ncbi:hypothetical protein F5882DRAFT_54779 [Hyaloscypha sp. PMI_1271]|nr:hypothetical protein F5882DRAFT_54779 [Hyaloscypha sp. PMI_1271]
MANQNYYRCLNPEEELQSSGSNIPPRRRQRPQSYVKNETPPHSPLLGASTPLSARTSALVLPRLMLLPLVRSSLESNPSIVGYDNYTSKIAAFRPSPMFLLPFHYPCFSSCNRSRSLSTGFSSIFCYDPLPYYLQGERCTLPPSKISEPEKHPELQSPLPSLPADKSRGCEASRGGPRFRTALQESGIEFPTSKRAMMSLVSHSRRFVYLSETC